MEWRIAELAAGQEGVVTAGQLRELGVSHAWVQRRIGRGLLHRVHRGVYAVGHPWLGLGGQRWAALLAAGQGAVLSHRTAADLWELRPSNRRVIDVTIGATAGRKPRRGIRLHRGPLPEREVTVHRRFPVTTPARTLLDLAAVLTARALERAIDEAERRRLFDGNAVDAVLEANRGRSGRPQLTAVLDRHRPGTTRTRSGLEERFLALCRAHRIPQPEVNVPIGPYIVDFLWPAQRLIVETDGRAAHRTARAFERDRVRDAYLTAAAYRVVRYTMLRLSRHPGDVVRELRIMLGLGAERSGQRA